MQASNGTMSDYDYTKLTNHATQPVKANTTSTSA
jgi:hypothetical protein